MEKKKLQEKAQDSSGRSSRCSTCPLLPLMLTPTSFCRRCNDMYVEAYMKGYRASQRDNRKK